MKLNDLPAQAVPSTYNPTEHFVGARGWQTGAANTFTEAVTAAGETDLFLYAAPGGGKTKFALDFAHWALSAGHVDAVLVMAPTEAICEGFRRDAEIYPYQSEDDVRAAKGKNGHASPLLLRIADGQELRESAASGIRGGYKGLIVTYALAANNVAAIQALCRPTKAEPDKRRRVLVIGDECHWLAAPADPHGDAEGRVWGSSINEAAGYAHMRLGMSGTPWRTDQQKLGLFRKGEEAATTFAYSIRDALIDGVIWAPSFRFHDGEVVISEAGKRDDEERMLSDSRGMPLPEPSEQMPMVDFLALDTEMLGISVRNEAFYSEMLTSGVLTLNEQRKTNPLVGGLVVCSNITHAKLVKKWLEQHDSDVVSGDATVTMAASDDTEARDRLTTFKGKPTEASYAADCRRQKWLVGVDMVAEGYNCPRLKTLVYLAEDATPRKLVQVDGRVLRAWDVAVLGPRVMPEIIAPDHPRVRVMGRLFQNLTAEAIKLDSSVPPPKRRGGGDDDDDGRKPRRPPRICHVRMRNTAPSGFIDSGGYEWPEIVLEQERTFIISRVPTFKDYVATVPPAALLRAGDEMRKTPPTPREFVPTRVAGAM